MAISKHKKTLFTLTIVILCLSLFSLQAYAETQYVSDTLIITMREGQGNEYKIIKTLRSGTPVEVVEEVDKYMRVRTEDGKEGWVLKRYITPDTPKPVIIAGLKSEIDKLNATIEKIKKERTSLKGDLDAVNQDHAIKIQDLQKSIADKDNEIAALTKQLQDTTRKYNVFVESSKDVVSVVNERDMLRKENNDLSEERDKLRTENDNLIEKRMIYWFLAGAGVFFFGWVSGKLSRKKKRYY
jgi:SH3 domain protein